MRILFLHGWSSTPGGVKPTYLKNHGHEVLNPALPNDDFDRAVRIAQAEADRGQPAVVVGSSRGGAVAMHLNTAAPLVLLCPAWKRWGPATTVKPGTVILHSRADETVPFADSDELLRNSGLALSALIVVGYIAFSQAQIDGNDCGWLALGPLAVAPQRQRQGIGQALVNEGLRTIRSMGARGCVLVGDPGYYRRFGFGHDPALRMDGVPPEVVLCLPLCGPMPAGAVTHHPAFHTGL